MDSTQADNRFLNRESSWIEFNRRVLEEGLDRSQPLLERLKFLSIFSTNLDEFFMIRVSGLQEQVEAGPEALSPDGLTPAAQLQLISERLRPLLRMQSDCLLNEILPGLERAGIRIVSYCNLSEQRRAELRVYYEERVFPVLTPLSVDPSHPFPYISNISLNLGILLASEADDGTVEPRFARVKIPPNVPRLVQVGTDNSFVLLEDLISANIGSLFPGLEFWDASRFVLPVMPISRSKRMRRTIFSAALNGSCGSAALVLAYDSKLRKA